MLGLEEEEEEEETVVLVLCHQKPYLPCCEAVVEMNVIKARLG